MGTQTVSKNNNMAQWFQSTPWLPYVLVIGFGGAAFTLSTLGLLHYFLNYFEEADLVDLKSTSSIIGPIFGFFAMLIVPMALKTMRNSTPGSSLDLQFVVIAFFVLAGLALVFPIPSQIVALTCTLACIGLVSYLVMCSFSSSRIVRLCAVGIWCFAYMAIWMIGAHAPIGLPLFIVLWTAIGFGGGMLLHAVAKSSLAKEETAIKRYEQTNMNARTFNEGLAHTRRRAGRTSGTVSRYGRIPQDTVDLFTNHVRRITGPVVAALPIGASMQRRNRTVSILLAVLISDWRKNDNFDMMSAEDIDDFQSFIEMAASVSGTEDSPVNFAIYTACLNALAKDWLDNWNATENSGPPDRIY